jgi:actin related protein 2/3 complex, subunit 1A/1B
VEVDRGECHVPFLHCVCHGINLSLSQHDLLVSSIDWSPVTNKIVTCSHDRNAFVWTFDAASNNWKPSLVMLKIDRAAIDCKWSSDGKRFAVSSGAKCICVCTYYPPEDW